MAHIIITSQNDGATVRFPKNASVIKDLKATFPKARWNPDAREWHVPGVRAGKRLETWAAKHEPAFVAAEQARRVLEWQGIETDPAKALANRASEIRSSLASVANGVVTYGFPYLAESVAIARKMPGARWNAEERHWTFRPSSLEEIDAIITGCNEILSLNMARQRADEERRAAAEQKRAQEVREKLAGSTLWVENLAPALGVPFWHRDRVVVATRIGKPIKVDTDAFLAIGGNLDIEWCVDVWLRDATESEAADILEARGKATAAAAAAEKRRKLIDALAAEKRIKNGRPVSVGYGPAMKVIEQMGIGTAHLWRPDSKMIDFYLLSYAEAEAVAQAVPFMERAIRDEIARCRHYEEILAIITPAEREEAERFLR